MTQNDCFPSKNKTSQRKKNQTCITYASSQLLRLKNSDNISICYKPWDHNRRYLVWKPILQCMSNTRSSRIREPCHRIFARLMTGPHFSSVEVLRCR